MTYASDLADEQRARLEPVFNAPGKCGPKQALHLRRVADGMLYISHTGCEWRWLAAGRLQRDHPAAPARRRGGPVLSAA